jgi:hypothetical protein
VFGAGKNCVTLSIKARAQLRRERRGVTILIRRVARDRKSSAFALDLEFGRDVAGDRTDRQSCHLRWLKTAIGPTGG